MILASPGPLGRPLEGFLERLGGLLARLGAILGVLRRCFGVSRPSWAVWAASWGSLDPSWGPLAPRKVTRGAAGDPRGDAGSPRGDATSPRKIATRGSEPLKNSSGVRTEAQGRVRGPENTPIRASRHGGGYPQREARGHGRAWKVKDFAKVKDWLRAKKRTNCIQQSQAPPLRRK